MTATGTTASASVCPPVRRSSCFIGPRAFPFPSGERNLATPVVSETQGWIPPRKAATGTFLGRATNPR